MGGPHPRLQLSHAVAFRAAALVLIGAYLAAMIAIAQGLALIGGTGAQALQSGFVAAASAVALALVPSRRLRGWLRVMLAKHLFRHRYDYRAEWQRLTRTIATKGAPGAERSLEERIVRAVAEMADSPAGLLLTPGEGGQLELAARWNWPTVAVPAQALPAETVRALAASGHIADLDRVRAGQSAGFAVPGWLVAEPRGWATVPLLHFERLVGLVVLAHPLQPRALDWEDFDLLRAAGQQLASYLAEHTGQQALAEAARFDDFHRRIAFVMHDLKNLASQLALLARNAERHAERPEFRADMLITLRNSADKLAAMLARLSRYGPTMVGAPEPVRADLLVQAVASSFPAGAVVTVASGECPVLAVPEPLEQVLGHLVRNALDASAPPAQVFVGTRIEGGCGVIEVLDAGAGMSAEFVRTRLFRPFDSTKPGGFGIGAYEARELVRAMHGRLDVESREGLGTRVAIRLPLAEAAPILRELGEAA